ncbi:MAG TPA: choice-of-anchor J domain-containing protein [Tenuifilaceae bacterium]|nr:choice-of-anchor J domain-containing protein [Tenuifilaceae bacterium]
MRKILHIIAIGVALTISFSSTGFAQKVLQSVKTESSTPFYTPKSEEWLRYDDGENKNSIGAGEVVFDIAIRFEPDDLTSYDEMQISKVNVYVNDVVTTSTIMIWQGADGENLTEVTSQEFTPTGEAWNEVTLETPCTIDAELELWIGVRYASLANNFPAGIDAASDHSGKGNMVRFPEDEEDDAWYALTDLEASLVGDWNIAALVGDGGTVETVDVTFNVDMTDVEGFDPATHKVFLTGTITDWAVPGTEGSIEMTQVTSKELPTTLSESFEDFADFTTDLTPWTTIQLTTGETYGSNGFDFDGEATEFAFMAFNPAATEPAIDGDYPAQDGSKFAVAIQYSGKDDNKWLISPQMMGTSTSVLSFYAMSYTLDYGAERIKVLVSTTDNDPNSFSAISEGDYIEVPDNWTKYEFDLSDYDGQEFYFAIQYVSYDAFIFMLDNIQVTSSGGGTEEIFYTATVAVEPGEIQYKYFSDLVGTGWDGGEWVGDPDRVVTISEATTLNDVWGDKPQDVDTETLNNATSIYPNPVSDVLTVSHNSRISGIRVFDVTGRMMYNAEVSNLNTTTVDVSRFNEGVYILQVVTNEGIANKKFVVK